MQILIFTFDSNIGEVAFVGLNTTNCFKLVVAVEKIVCVPSWFAACDCMLNGSVTFHTTLAALVPLIIKLETAFERLADDKKEVTSPYCASCL